MRKVQEEKTSSLGKERESSKHPQVSIFQDGRAHTLYIYVHQIAEDRGEISIQDIMQQQLLSEDTKYSNITYNLSYIDREYS
jgi:hypothetical protein